MTSGGGTCSSRLDDLTGSPALITVSYKHLNILEKIRGLHDVISYHVL